MLSFHATFIELLGNNRLTVVNYISVCLSFMSVQIFIVFAEVFRILKLRESS